MKTITCIVLTILFSTASMAQLTKGNWLMGGNASYSAQKSRGQNTIVSDTKLLDIQSNVGYFIIDKLAGGLIINGQLYHIKYPQPDGSIGEEWRNSIGTGPFIRYYFLSTDNRINIFSAANFLYTFNWGKSSYTSTYNDNASSYEISGGAVVFLNTSVGAEVSLGYNKKSYTDFDSKGEGIVFRIGFQIHLEKD